MYHLQEGAFELPREGYVDRSVQILEMGEGPTHTALVVAREPSSATPREFLDAFLSANGARKPRYRLLQSTTVDVAGVAAEAATYSWLKDGEALTTHLVVFPSGGNMLTLAATGHAARSEATNALVQRVVRSFRFRRPE